MKIFWQKNKLLIAILLFSAVFTTHLYRTSYTSEPKDTFIREAEIIAQPSTQDEEILKKTDESTDYPIQKDGRTNTADTEAIHKKASQSPTSTTATTNIEVEKFEEKMPITVEEIPQIKLTFEVPHLSYLRSNTSVDKGSSVYDAMAHLQKTEGLAFSGNSFGSLGYFIDSIGQIQNDKLGGKYWIYYINGKKAQIGISNYIIQPNDIITWKYEHETY